MRIQVKRSGGFAGGTRRSVVDTAGRPDAAQWQALARQALAAGHTVPREVVYDGFRYEITVDDRTVRCADPLVDDAQRDLIDKVMREGGRSPGP